MHDTGCDNFREKLKSFIEDNSLGGAGKPNLSIRRTTEWVNEALGLQKDETYSQRTVGDWMPFLGFDIVLVKKTLYVDGHVREERFGKQLDNLVPKLLTIDDVVIMTILWTFNPTLRPRKF